MSTSTRTQGAIIMSELTNDSINVKGHINIKLISPDGVIKQEIDKNNLIVTSGKTYLATWLAAASQSGEFMSYVGLGTSSTPPSTSDTALGAELSGGGYSRQVGTLTSSTNTWQNVDTFGPGNGTGALTEAGLFSTVTSGTMFAHQVFSTINKASGDTLVITWTVQFS
jgi:hypothetical protein